MLDSGLKTMYRIHDRQGKKLRGCCTLETNFTFMITDFRMRTGQAPESIISVEQFSDHRWRKAQ